MKQVIATWFYIQDEAEGGSYSQVKGDSHSERFRDVYRRCIGVFVATARAAAPEAEIVIYLNEPWDPSSSSTAREIYRLAESMRASFRVVPYSFAPPSGWKDAWKNQFFVFDVLTDLAKTVDPADVVVVLDSDVVWTGVNTDRLWNEISDHGGIRYVVGYELEHSINGMTQIELAKASTRAAADLGWTLPVTNVIPYSGGEFVGLRGDMLTSVVERAPVAWEYAKQQFLEGIIVFPEEAHFLSFLYELLGVDADASSVIRRIWTRFPGHRNTLTSDMTLVLWHVPAEKRFGIARIYRRLITSGSVARSPEQLGKELGLPRVTLSKFVRDMASISILPR